MFRNNPGTLSSEAFHEQETAATPASLATVKPALHKHGVREGQPGMKPMLIKMSHPYTMLLPTWTRQMHCGENRYGQQRRRLNYFVTMS